jgi:hypothetical protein
MTALRAVIGGGKKTNAISQVPPEPAPAPVPTPDQPQRSARSRNRRRNILMTPGRTLGAGADQGTRSTLGP